MHADWLIPEWPAPASVRALFTTRFGGQSPQPYASMNLGDHVGDQAPHVAANRTALARAMDASPVYLNQVHGHGVIALRTDTPAGLSADASLTTEPGLACCIMVADCLPVLLTDRQGTFVAAAHAGWRGLAGAGLAGGQGVLASLIKQLQHNRGVQTAQDATDLIAWLGPCIGPHAFEVGEDVRQAFAQAQDSWAEHFIPAEPSKWLADLAGLARQQLRTLGVNAVYGNDSSEPWCTVNNPSRFFSYRRDGPTGRMGALIWRV
jgi:polyphenol oxidase